MRVAGSLTDITDRRMAEEQLRHMASHDALTGLPNRNLLMDRIGRCLLRTKRNPDYLFAVLFLDLDRFKNINDSLGHVLGDELLVAISKRLTGHLRALDTVTVVQQNTLARVGGDEFVLLLDGIRTPTDAIRVAERIVQALTEHFELSGHDIFSSTSIGICVSKTSYTRPEEILRDADIALYQAKMEGTGRYSLFDTKMHAAATARWRMENDLRRAIERDELTLQFQPIVTLRGGDVEEVEALARWNHLELGPVSPADFIPLAEETGLIVPLEYWVLRRVCQQLQHWHETIPGMGRVSVAVNVSGKQFAESNFIETLTRILQETAVPAEWIKLEITETSRMSKTAETVALLSRLHSMGIRFYLDDFGTGYSSLSYLRKMPIQALKIDRSFVATMNTDPMSHSIVQAIVTLAHAMDMHVVAEGVETEAQLEQLKSLRREYAQGFYLHRPMDADQLAKIIGCPAVGHSSRRPMFGLQSDVAMKLT